MTKITYYTEYVGHFDGSVTYILPGFYELQSLGLILLGGGLAVFIVYVIIVKMRFLTRYVSE